MLKVYYIPSKHIVEHEKYTAHCRTDNINKSRTIGSKILSSILINSLKLIKDDKKLLTHIMGRCPQRVDNIMTKYPTT